MDLRPSRMMGWRLRRFRPDIGFGAFISYSGVQDRALISELQNGIEKLAKPWYRPPAVKVFFDKTSIAAGTRLWSRIEYGLSRSRWLILMASRQAAESPWVGREVEWWLHHRPLDNLLILHTDGKLCWDSTIGDFSKESTALPPLLRGVFPDEPVWATIPRDNQGKPDIDSAVLSVTSAVRGIPVHELSSQAFREHRRTMRWARATIAVLSLLLVGAVVASVIAAVQKQHADRQATIAVSRQLASTAVSNLPTNPRAALLLAASAYDKNPNAQTFSALMQADTANPKLVRYFPVGSVVAQLGASGDGKTLVAGLGDGQVVRWTAPDGTPEPVMKLGAAVSSVAVSGDGSIIVASDGKTASLSRSGQDPVTLDIPAGQGAGPVALSPSGRTALIHSKAATYDGPETTVVYDPATATQTAVHDDGASRLQITSNLVLPSDNEVLLFDDGYGGWQRRRIADWSLEDSGNAGFGVHQIGGVPSSNGEFITATNGSSTIPVWRTAGPSDPDHPGFTAQAPISQAGPLVLSPDGSNLAVANGGSIYVAPVAPENAVTPAEPICCGQAPNTGPVRGPTVQLPGAGTINSVGLLRFVGDNSHLISATGNQVALWNLNQIDRLVRATATPIPKGSTCTACPGSQIVASADGKHVAVVAGNNSALAIAPLPGAPGIPRNIPGLTGIPLWRFDGHLTVVISSTKSTDGLSIPHGVEPLLGGDGADRVAAAALTPDEKTLVVVNSRGVVFLQDPDSGKIRDKIPGPVDLELGNDQLADAAINISARLIATVDNGSASIYDLATRNKIGAVGGDDVTHVRFSGPRLLVQRKNGNLEVWDDRGSAMTRLIGGDQSYFYPPASDSRGQLVARLRQQSTIDVYDLQTGALVDSIPPYPRAVKTGIAFAPNRQSLLAAIDSWDNNTEVVVRDLSPSGLTAAACAAAGSNLSAEEWQVLAGGPVGSDPCR